MKLCKSWLTCGLLEQKNVTQLQTILVLSSTVDKKINVTLENLKENIYKLILPADTKGEEWKLPGRLGSEVVFGNLQSFNFTSLTSNCIGALSETSSSEAGYTEVWIGGRHFWTLLQLLHQASVTSQVHFECTSFMPPYQQQSLNLRLAPQLFDVNFASTHPWLGLLLSILSLVLSNPIYHENSPSLTL